MKQNQALTRVLIESMSRNVYCDHSDRDHKILGSCRVMCNPVTDRKTPICSNPHQLTWSQLQARSAAPDKEPILDTAIGGVALAILFIAISLI